MGALLPKLSAPILQGLEISSIPEVVYDDRAGLVMADAKLCQQSKPLNPLQGHRSSQAPNTEAGARPSFAVRYFASQLTDLAKLGPSFEDLCPDITSGSYGIVNLVPHGDTFDRDSRVLSGIQ